MRRSIYVHGAYGRLVKFSEWKKGLDFQIWDGPYFSIRDCEALKAAGWERIVFCNKGWPESSFVHELT